MTSQAALISPSAHVYERLSDVGSPPNGSPQTGYRSLPLGDDSDSDTGDDYGLANRQRAPAAWLSRILGQRSPPPVQSNLLTLIPLTDDRLKPRHTACLVSCLLLLAVALAAGVFIAVPRGVTVGSIQVRSSRMSFNTSKSTYQIILTATIPIFNPNYMPVVRCVPSGSLPVRSPSGSVQVSGDLVVSFYDQQAGTTGLEPVSIPARAFPEVITVDMDASSVPQEYLFTIYTQCFTFPERIIFFLTGKLTSRYLGWTFTLPDIDNYFIISCTNAPERRPEPPHVPGRPVKPPHPPGAPPKPPHPPRYLGAGEEAGRGVEGEGEGGMVGGLGAEGGGAAGLEGEGEAEAGL
ncbi:hypothetical protein PLESTF_000134900 [Pleodorina starrii]|nr:hypothetical protein PLESTM_000017200 [Pleodorina starrii]GLC64196.1 hypothetical protein PLESTF_000134900 [Pleodorina starrii]